MVIHRVEQYTLRVILKHYTDYSRKLHSTVFSNGTNFIEKFQ